MLSNAHFEFCSLPKSEQHAVFEFRLRVDLLEIKELFQGPFSLVLIKVIKVHYREANLPLRHFALHHKPLQLMSVNFCSKNENAVIDRNKFVTQQVEASAA
ncbi:hypothetical protein QR680_018313 [Steinernema hermaphroditum]|nr:hypothetical protein QR680_018313 [Steinernema hermaphroditum]